MGKSASILKLSELELKELLPGARARFVHSENMTLSHFEFEAGVLLPEHSHPHEQITDILDGVFELTIEGEPHRLETGMVAVILGLVACLSIGFSMREMRESEGVI